MRTLRRLRLLRSIAVFIVAAATTADAVAATPMNHITGPPSTHPGTSPGTSPSSSSNIQQTIKGVIAAAAAAAVAAAFHTSSRCVASRGGTNPRGGAWGVGEAGRDGKAAAAAAVGSSRGFEDSRESIVGTVAAAAAAAVEVADVVAAWFGCDGDGCGERIL